MVERVPEGTLEELKWKGSRGREGGVWVQWNQIVGDDGWKEEAFCSNEGTEFSVPSDFPSAFLTFFRNCPSAWAVLRGAQHVLLLLLFTAEQDKGGRPHPMGQNWDSCVGLLQVGRYHFYSSSLSKHLEGFWFHITRQILPLQITSRI